MYGQAYYCRYYFFNILPFSALECQVGDWVVPHGKAVYFILDLQLTAAFVNGLSTTNSATIDAAPQPSFPCFQVGS